MSAYRYHCGNQLHFQKNKKPILEQKAKNKIIILTVMFALHVFNVDWRHQVIRQIRQRRCVRVD